VKAITNLGSTEVAGWLPVPGKVGQVIQTPQCGSGIQVGARGLGEWAARQWPIRLRVTGGAGHIATTKGPTSFIQRRTLRGWGSNPPSPALGKVWTRVKGIRLGRAGFL
jgi:hypothetical protein